jgi:hypothetical protein
MGMTITRPAARPYYSPRPPIGRRIFVWLLRLCGLLVLGGIGYLVLFSPSLRDAVVAIARGELSPAVSFPGRSAVTVLVMGRDRDLNNRKQVLNTPGRSDVMMLARWDFDYRTLSVLSIPRDTWVRIPGRGWHKINAAHSMGGPALAARVPPQNQRMTTLPSRIGKSYVYPDPAAAQALVREYFGMARRS